METLSRPTPNFEPEQARELIQALILFNSKWEPLEGDCEWATFHAEDKNKADIVFFDGAIKIEKLSGASVWRSMPVELPAEFDNFNRAGGTEIVITEAHLEDEIRGEDLGKTSYIELRRPRGNHHLIELIDSNDEEDLKVLRMFDENGLEVAPNPETDELIEGLIDWGAERQVQYEAKARQETANELYRLFNMDLIPWRVDVEPHRGYKVFAAGRPGFSTAAVRLQRSHHKWLNPAQDPFAVKDKRSMTKFGVIKEIHSDGKADLSIEVLRTSGPCHLITMKPSAETDDVELKIFDTSAQEMTPNDKTDTLLASLLHWTKDARA